MKSTPECATPVGKIIIKYPLLIRQYPPPSGFRPLDRPSPTEPPPLADHLKQCIRGLLMEVIGTEELFSAYENAQNATVNGMKTWAKYHLLGPP